jgi:pyridoxamine 5'-phosphate oxidase
MQVKNTNDPFGLFSGWFEEAKKSHLEPQDTAVNLATADAEGKPSARIVLLKAFDERGFVFYTNLESKKASDLRINPHAELCFYWPANFKQVRIAGTTTQVSDEEADAYFATRPRESQIAAWVSRQSEVLESREVLVKLYGEFEKKHQNKIIPRPPFWSGYRLVPERFEFWIAHQFRLNERILFRKEGGNWVRELLYP